MAPIHSYDAVLVVPGIMGSQLFEGDEPLWAPRVGPVVGAVVPSRGTAERLALTDEEASDLDAGRVPTRVQARSLISRPAWAPFLQGLRPYDDLVKRLRRATTITQPEQVSTFPYDWRLDVETNARLLAVRVRQVVDEWRRRVPSHQRTDDRPDGIVIVAHSMGGLVAQAMWRMVEGDELGSEASRRLREDVRAVVTLATPFRGSTKAVAMLAGRWHHEWADRLARCLPSRVNPFERLGAAARTLPGLYDLLPDYRCVLSPDSTSVVALDPQTLAAWGGDRSLAEAAMSRRTRNEGVTMPGHRRLVGQGQVTTTLVQPQPSGPLGLINQVPRIVQATGNPLTEDDGRVRLVDALGDGTVTDLPGDPSDVVPVTQRHGALAGSAHTVHLVESVLRGTEPQSPLGGTGLGLDVPHFGQVGQHLTVGLRGLGPLRLDVNVTAVHLETGKNDAARTRRGWVDREQGLAEVSFVPRHAGLYEVSGSRSTTKVTEWLLVLEEGAEHG